MDQIRPNQFRFETEKGELFNPIGVMYYRVCERGGAGADTFAPDFLSNVEIEKLGQELEAYGINLVRLFAGGENHGVMFNGDSIDEAFMRRVINFIRRLGRYGIRTLLELTTPYAFGPYSRYFVPDRDRITGDHNNVLFNETCLTAHRRFLDDYLALMLRLDPHISPSIFSVELRNEAAATTAGRPLQSTKGDFELYATGDRYDLASKEDRLRLIVAGFVHFVGGLVPVVRRHLPEVMVSVSTMTPAQVGRTGYLDNMPRVGAGRVPIPAATLAATSLSMVDVHCYLANRSGAITARDLVLSASWPDVLSACRRHDKPIFAGELGAYYVLGGQPRETDDQVQRRAANFWSTLNGYKFSGFSWWTFNTRTWDVWHATKGKRRLLGWFAELAGRASDPRGAVHFFSGGSGYHTDGFISRHLVRGWYSIHKEATGDPEITDPGHFVYPDLGHAPLPYGVIAWETGDDVWTQYFSEGDGLYHYISAEKQARFRELHPDLHDATGVILYELGRKFPGLNTPPMVDAGAWTDTPAKCCGEMKPEGCTDQHLIYPVHKQTAEGDPCELISFEDQNSPILPETSE